MVVKSRAVVAIVFGVAAAVGVAYIGLSECRSNHADDTLVFTQVLFRHGNRTPDTTFPTDRYLNYSYYPVGLGQLTNGGKMTEYKLGQYCRHRYNHFLGSILDPDVMLVRSTDVQRTKNSASLVCAGLWPAAPPNQWAFLGLGSMWNPIPLEVTPLAQDNLLYFYGDPCPAYNREYDRVVNSTEVQKLLDSFSELREYLSKHTGMEVDLPYQAYLIYQALLGQKEFGLELPYWAHSVFPKKMAPFVDLFFVLNVYNQKLQKLQSGRLLREINQNNVDAANGTLLPKGRKIVLYSAHDTTVSAFLVTLGVYNNMVPPYGIAVLVELHRIRANTKSPNILNRFGVKLFLRNTTSHDPYALTLPNCDQLCPLDRFILLTSNKVIKDDNDWQAECK